MIEATFYIAQELNDRYTDVYDNTANFWNGDTPLESYLRNLPSKSVFYDNMYITNQGTLNISINDISTGDGYFNFQKFNYMKIKDIDTPENTRYYFIDDIELANKLYVVHYKLDIWSSFSPHMKLRDAVLSRTLHNVDAIPHALPVAYNSNEPLQFSGSDNDNFYVVVEASYYVISADANESTQRQNITCFVGYQSSEEVSMTHDEANSRIVGRPEIALAAYQTSYTREEAFKLINQLTSYQGTKSKPKGTTYGDLGVPIDIYGEWIPMKDVALMYYDRYENPLDKPPLKDTVYDIQQMYVIPADVVEFNGLSEPGRKLEMGISILNKAYRVGDGPRTEKYNWSNIAFYKIDNAKPAVGTINKVIEANPLTAGFGFKDLMFPLSYNGLNMKVRFDTYLNDLGFSLMMSYGDNQLVNATSLFEVPLPFTTPTGEERQLNSMAKSMAKWQTAIGIGAAAIGVVAPAVSRGRKVARGAYNFVKQAEEDFGEGPATFKENLGIGLEGARIYHLDHPSNISPGSTTLAGLGSALTIAQNINQINTPVNYSKSANSKPNAFINASYGFGTYTIVPNNQQEVFKTILKIGYNVYQHIDNIHKDNTKDQLITQEYEVLQFGDGTVNGPFSQKVARTLEAILRNGIRIHYD